MPGPSKPILPWPVLGVGVLVAIGAAVIAFVQPDLGGGGGGSSSPTPAPTATLGPISGTIGYITPEGNFALMDGNGGHQQTLTSDGVAKSFVWAPDGSVAAVEVATGSQTGVRGVRPDGSVSFNLQRASGPLWSPDGKRLAFTGENAVNVYDAAGALERTFDSAVRPTWSPDGNSIAFLKLAADGKAVPVIGDLATGEETPLAQGIEATEPVYPIAWHPAGSVIAYRNHLYEPSTGNVTELPGTAIFWSPNGKTLLIAKDYSPSDRATPGLLLDAAEGFKTIIGLSIRPSAEDIPAQLFIQKWTAWTHDGRYLFYLDPEQDRNFVRIYDTQMVTQDRHANIAGERPDISPDGKAAAFMYQGKVWVVPMDVSALAAVASGGYPAWRPGP